MFLVLMYPINSKIDPKPCMHSANRNMLKVYACKDAKITITNATDTIMDNLRLFENLKHNLKKNTNGMNLMNSSLIRKILM